MDTSPRQGRGVKWNNNRGHCRYYKSRHLELGQIRYMKSMGGYFFFIYAFLIVKWEYLQNIYMLTLIIYERGNNTAIKTVACSNSSCSRCRETDFSYRDWEEDRSTATTHVFHWLFSPRKSTGRKFNISILFCYIGTHSVFASRLHTAIFRCY